MDRFRLVNLGLLLLAADIVVGLVGFVVARLGGHDAWVPFFGTVLGAGLATFAGLLAVGLLVGAWHCAHWVVRIVLRRPAPDWGRDPAPGGEEPS